MNEFFINRKVVTEREREKKEGEGEKMRILTIDYIY